MKKEDIEVWDWNRLLFGNAPPEFVFEVFLRTIVTFVLLLVVLRLLGKKMNGQLNLTETAVMITLGAIISIPMQMPDRGVLLGIVALTCILILQRFVSWIGTKARKIENFTQGKMSILVKDGVMDLHSMAVAGISKQELFSALREKSYHNLAKAKRVYFEACGMMNVYEESKKRSGLSIHPTSNPEMYRDADKDHEHMACKNCGSVVDTGDQEKRCPTCHQVQWIEAIY